MPRRRADPDPELVLAALSPVWREAAAEAVEVLGLSEWTDCPPLRTLLPILAAQGLAADMDGLPAGDALAEAAELLGLEDDPELSTRPSDCLGRTLRRWIRDSSGPSGQVVQPPEEGAA